MRSRFKTCRLFLALSCALLAASCARPFWVYHVSVQQGNIITPKMMNQLEIGMSSASVEEIMGTPVLIDTFSNHRLNYVYTFQPSGGCMELKRVTLIFRNNRLARIQR